MDPPQKGMVESALYNAKLLEDLDFTDFKISLKASDVMRTIEAYRMLRPLVIYPFHLGVTEAGNLFSSSIKSAMALGAFNGRHWGYDARIHHRGIRK